MYDPGKGAGAVGLGAVLLPNTGGNRLVATIAVISIAVGVAIIVSTIARAVAAKAVKA
jgi:hypothetical protein